MQGHKIFLVTFLALLLTACGGVGGGALPLSGAPEPAATTSASITPVPGQTSTPAPVQTPAPVSSPSSNGSAPAHVLTFAYIYGYGGAPASIPLNAMSPYASWAMTDEAHAPLLRAAGVKVMVYSNFWRNYASDNPNVGYVDLKPGGAHAAAEAVTCSGTPLFDPNYGGGYLADGRSSAASGHAQVVASYRLREFGSNYDALMSDDTGAFGDVGFPCSYTLSAMASAENAVHAALNVPLFVNTLGAGNDPIAQVAFENAPNILGAQCEECYSTNAGAPVTGSRWQDTETSEISTTALKKIFWAYPRATTQAASSLGLRMYLYASFLLTFEPAYAMFQEALITPHGFPVMPETGLVPMDPLTTQTTIGAYRQPSGVYVREFASCYYRGVNQGRCAVAVNSDSSTEAVSAPGYTRSMALAGGGVLDGGSAGFNGGAVQSLAPGTAAILF